MHACRRAALRRGPQRRTGSDSRPAYPRCPSGLKTACGKFAFVLRTAHMRDLCRAPYPTMLGFALRGDLLQQPRRCESLFVHVVTMATMIDPNFTPQTHTLLEIRAPLQTQIMLEVALYRMW